MRATARAKDVGDDNRISLPMVSNVEGNLRSNVDKYRENIVVCIEQHNTHMVLYN